MEELRRKILLQGEDTGGLGSSQYGLFASIRNNKNSHENASSDPFKENTENAKGEMKDVSTHSFSSARSGSASYTSNTELSGHGVGSGFESGLGPGSSADNKYGGHSTDKLRMGIKKSSSNDNDTNNNNNNVHNNSSRTKNNNSNNNNYISHQHSHSHASSSSSNGNGGHYRERERERDRDIRGKLIKSGTAFMKSLHTSTHHITPMI